MGFDPSLFYDVAIVGAGPAGSTLARLLADSGTRILLIDGRGDGPGKVCGGLLAPDAQKALARFDLTLPKSVLVDPQIFSVKTIDAEAGLVRYYSRFYVNADRKQFDRWLLGLVPDTVDVLTARCGGVAREADGFLLEVHPGGGEAVSVRSRIVVGADGADSVVRRAFYRTDIQRYVSIQQWFRADDTVSPFYSCIFDPVTSESCSWSIHKDGYFIYGGSFAPEGCREKFEEQKRRVNGKYGFRFSEPIRTEACLVCRPRRLHDFVTGRDGAYLVGEAAGLISPSSFEGISSAILSADALAAALRAGGNVARDYRRATLPLRLKLRLKCFKRWFMYVPPLRRLVMKSGLRSIEVQLR